IYNIGWNWWWDHSDESFASYLNNTSIKPVAEGNLSTANGKGTLKFRVDYPGWGRYLVYVKDREGGHATGGVIYVDWPDWRGRSRKSDPSGITMLAFSTDKSSYEAGEEVVVTIPAASGGRALAAIENGSEVISREWIHMTGSGDTKYRFKITEDMAPNVYLHISLLQPHKQTLNDLPVRMYGVAPVFVTNRNSILKPQITMDEVLRPETEFTVKVKETTGKAMTYTLAVVDDGLLDLTNFKTPDPWNEFYAREALGIRTWDMYDLVMGAFEGKYGSLFSVGGDLEGAAPNAKANRFKPVVKFIGPVTLKKGEEKTHRLKLPPYIGSVRVMVVAGQDGAYGNAEKTVPVRTPLMILPSLPRVVSVHEEIALPVNVFAMENSVKNVSVKVETAAGLMQLADAGNKSVDFSAPGDQMVYFTLKTGASTGVEKVTVTATGNGHTSRETIEIDVRNPNPAIVRSDNRLIEAGKSADFTYNSAGNDDGWVKMEVSRIPSIEISRSFDFLADYPHYCSEQLTSSALPLLFLEDFKTLSDRETEMVKDNVRSAISNLYGRQLPNGGITYWPGEMQEDRWITSYAGSFLLLAKEKGYEVNQGVLTRWKNYQRKQAQNFRITDSDNKRYRYYQHDLEQAYRLYTLALAGSPETGAMNRLKEVKTLSLQARWRLAAAYALAGKTDAASELIFNIPTDVDAYSTNNSSYGSSYRDEALILETLILTGRDRDAFEQARKIAKYLSHEQYYTTQTVACALVAMGRMVQKMSGSLDFDWTLNGANQPAVKSNRAVFQTDFPAGAASGKASVTNTGNGLLYVNVVSKTRPLVDTLPPVSNKIKLDVYYASLDGTPVNVENLKQGTDFAAVIKVSNTGFDDYTNLALTHIIPSGWEVYNERMIHPDESDDSRLSSCVYQDIRDDRVLTYFDLPRGMKKEFKVRLLSSYAGSFALPAVQCEAMYDPEVQARTQAGRVVVER
ncbi:MAG: alpha-2-macroglobulin, partial [Tannerella sp.]|nr:alpha-2-macroglobulin [Tannerella sp.]